MEPYQIIPKLRKGKVLTPAQFGCLRGVPTLNVTNGCLFRCIYCYAQGYSQAPPPGMVELYINLPNLVKEELKRKRVLPDWVAINTSSDCFQTHPDILDVTFEVMEALLAGGIGIAFLTKGVIPQRFLSLFAGAPRRVLAQIGLVSMSGQYWMKYEPGTPHPEKRIETIHKMNKIGISPEVRIDPMIPFVTDTEPEMTGLFRALGAAGVRKVTLSYLHLRPSVERQLLQDLSPLHRNLVESCFKMQKWEEVGSSTRTKVLSKAVRERGYGRITKIAEGFGLTASICQCKNPDLEADICGSGRVKTAVPQKLPRQLTLFGC